MSLEFWYHHVGVSVPDMDASIAWYERVLGFKLERRFMIHSIPAEIAILKHGAMHRQVLQTAINGKSKNQSENAKQDPDRQQLVPVYPKKCNLREVGQFQARLAARVLLSRGARSAQ